MAMTAAMKKVLSPISETSIIPHDFRKPAPKPPAKILVMVLDATNKDDVYWCEICYQSSCAKRRSGVRSNRSRLEYFTRKCTVLDVTVSQPYKLVSTKLR